MAKLLISAHFLSFLVVVAGDGGQGSEVPAFAGTTVSFAETTHVDNVGVGAAMAQWASVVGCGVAARRAAGCVQRYNR